MKEYEKQEILESGSIAATLHVVSENMHSYKSSWSGFYSITLVHSCIYPKIQFLDCLLSSVAPWGGPMLDIEGKFFEI